MLTVACVFVQGHVGFTLEYVLRLRLMVSKKLRQPHRFVCFTDQPDLIRRTEPQGLEIEVIRVSPLPDIFAWWSKLEMFNSEHGLTGRVIYLDLDVLVVDDLDPIADYPAPFALIPHAGDWKGKGKRGVVRKFNSSVMAFDVSDELHRLFDLFTPDVTNRLWGDQDWIGERMPRADTMPLAWFPRLSQIDVMASRLQIPKNAKVVLCKKPKNHIAVRQYPWFERAWR